MAGCWEKLHVDAVTPVVLLGADKVPAVNTIWCPCLVGAGIFMDEDSRTGAKNINTGETLPPQLSSCQNTTLEF